MKGSEVLSSLFRFGFRQVHVGVEDTVDSDLNLPNFVLKRRGSRGERCQMRADNPERFILLQVHLEAISASCRVLQPAHPLEDQSVGWRLGGPLGPKASSRV